MKYPLLPYALAALCILMGFTGCAGIRSAMNSAAVVASWSGKTPAEVTAKWGRPAIDLTGKVLKDDTQYRPMKTTQTGPLRVTDYDPDVVEVLVYKPAPGTTLVSADGKSKFTTTTDPTRETVISFGVYSSGNIENWSMKELPK